MAVAASSATLFPLFPFSPHTALQRGELYGAGRAPRLHLFLGRHQPLCYSLHSFSSRRWDLHRRGRVHLIQKATGKTLCSQVKLDDVDDEACELVNGVELVLGENQDSFHGYLLKAVKNNNGTGVLLLSDIYGFEDSFTRDFAYRVACSGYNVLVPDLFRGNPWKKGQPPAKFNQWLSKQPPERVAKDVDICTKWMLDEFMAVGISKKLGIIGFTFGGGLMIETLARDGKAYFGTGICFSGTRIDSLLGSSIKVPVLFVSGDSDPLSPVSTLKEIEKNIQGSRVVIYHGRGQGFVHRPESQEDDQAAEDAFEIMRNWLHAGLLETKD